MKSFWILLFLTGVGYAQDFLVSPQNQRLLFTAGSDEIQGFQRNPGYLGLYNRGAALDAYFFSPRSETPRLPGYYFHDLGIYAQLGKIGLAYRNAAAYGERSDEYTFGLGLGNSALGLGGAVTILNKSGISRAIPNIGLILQNKFVSLGASIHNFVNRKIGFHDIWKEWDVGIGVRPTGSSFLTFKGEASFFPASINYKFGLNTEIIPGLDIYAVYYHNGLSYPLEYTYLPTSYGQPVPLLEYRSTNTISIGVSFNFGSHFSVGGATIAGSGSNNGIFGRFMITSQRLSTILSQKRVTEVVVRGEIPDEREKGSFFMKPQKNLHDYVKEIKSCAYDRSVSGLILKIYPFSQSGEFFPLSAATQEMVDAVKEVRKSGKPVYAYLPEGAGVEELYLASSANKIYMPAGAIIANYGVELNLIRLKGLFDKLHISWNTMTAGRYKSTFHTEYTDSASPEQSKLIHELINELYSQMITQVENNRGIRLDSASRRELSSVMTPTEAVKLNIIDGVTYYDEFKKIVDKEIFGQDGNFAVRKSTESGKYLREWGLKPQVAVIGIYGMITSGESLPPLPFPIPFLGSERTTGSETVVNQIHRAMDDSRVKAIVLRVNSGGGSALASDEIYHAVKEARKIKPVIASFGNVAASGGYYVAADAERIFAEPATITGSIGVLIAFPELTGFLKNEIGANVEKYRAGESRIVLSPFNKWNEDDKKYVEAYINNAYEDFLSKVASGRNLTVDSVRVLAQGKVYLGSQALRAGLIDQVGGLDEAVQYAADRAGIGDDYSVDIYSVKGLFPFGRILGFSLGEFETLTGF